MRIHGRLLIGALLFGCMTLSGRVGAAQVSVHVPIHGVTGLVYLPYNRDKFYTDVHKLLTEIGDHVGGTSAPPVVTESSSLDTLQPGMPVVVHYMVKGIPASLNQGTVTAVDGKLATIRFADGARRTLRYTRHATKIEDGEVHHGNRVVVYSVDKSGYISAHYFKP